MGRRFLHFLDDDDQSRYTCGSCGADIASSSDFVWSGMMGNDRPAFLLRNTTANVIVMSSNRDERLSTGVYSICDVGCSCKAPLGWRYVAVPAGSDQEYKQGCSLLEQAALRYHPSRNSLRAAEAHIQEMAMRVTPAPPTIVSPPSPPTTTPTPAPPEPPPQQPAPLANIQRLLPYRAVVRDQQVNIDLLPTAPSLQPQPDLDTAPRGQAVIRDGTVGPLPSGRFAGPVYTEGDAAAAEGVIAGTGLEFMVQVPTHSHVPAHLRPQWEQQRRQQQDQWRQMLLWGLNMGESGASGAVAGRAAPTGAAQQPAAGAGAGAGAVEALAQQGNAAHQATSAQQRVEALLLRRLQHLQEMGVDARYGAMQQPQPPQPSDAEQAQVGQGQQQGSQQGQEPGPTQGWLQQQGQQGQQTQQQQGQQTSQHPGALPHALQGSMQELTGIGFSSMATTTNPGINIMPRTMYATTEHNQPWLQPPNTTSTPTPRWSDMPTIMYGFATAPSPTALANEPTNSPGVSSQGSMPAADTTPPTTSAATTVGPPPSTIRTASSPPTHSTSTPSAATITASPPSSATAAPTPAPTSAADPAATPATTAAPTTPTPTAAATTSPSAVAAAVAGSASTTASTVPASTPPPPTHIPPHSRLASFTATPITFHPSPPLTTSQTHSATPTWSLPPSISSLPLERSSTSLEQPALTLDALPFLGPLPWESMTHTAATPTSDTTNLAAAHSIFGISAHSDSSSAYYSSWTPTHIPLPTVNLNPFLYTTNTHPHASSSNISDSHPDNSTASTATASTATAISFQPWTLSPWLFEPPPLLSASRTVQLPTPLPDRPPNRAYTEEQRRQLRSMTHFGHYSLWNGNPPGWSMDSSTVVVPPRPPFDYPAQQPHLLPSPVLVLAQSPPLLDDPPTPAVVAVPLSASPQPIWPSPGTHQAQQHQQHEQQPLTQARVTEGSQHVSDTSSTADLHQELHVVSFGQGIEDLQQHPEAPTTPRRNSTSAGSTTVTSPPQTC